MEDEDKKIQPVSDEIVKPVSPVSEAREILDGIKKEKEELREERKKLEEARAEEVLSGSAGGHVEATPPKEETSEEYAKRVMNGQSK